MKILLIAPTHPDLPAVDSEIQAIDSYHEVVPVIGIVRETDITEAIGKHPEGFEVIWWCTHGGSLGVQLSDEVLTADGVGQYLVASQARLCVLNTCASEVLARQIIVGTDCDLIFTVSDLKDGNALRFGSLLAAELSKNDDYQKAFAAAAPQRGKYRYLQAKAAIRSLDMTVSSELQKLGDRLDGAIKKVDGVVQEIYQMQVDNRAAAVVFLRYQSDMEVAKNKLDILVGQGQTRDLQESLRKENRILEMEKMDRKIDNQSQTTLGLSSQSANAAVPVREQASTPITTWVLIVLLLALVLVALFFAFRSL